MPKGYLEFNFYLLSYSAEKVPNYGFFISDFSPEVNVTRTQRKVTSENMHLRVIKLILNSNPMAAEVSNMLVADTHEVKQTKI